MNSDVMPVGHLTRDQVQTVMRACAAAPPVLGRRPWRLICTPTALELRATGPATGALTNGSADSPAGPGARHPAENSAEPDRRDLLLSCGAALLNVRATIKRFGVHPAVRLIPDAEQPDLLALVHPQAGYAAVPADVALADAIAQRRTSRPLTGGIPVPMINRLRQAARVEQTWLAILPPGQLKAVQLGRFDVAADGSGADQLSSEGRSPGAPASRVMAVIGSFHDTPLAWLQSGQGTQRVLLTAEAAGLTTSLLSHVVRAAPTRAQLRRLIGGGVWPQAVLHLECAPTGTARPTTARQAAVRGPVSH